MKQIFNKTKIINKTKILLLRFQRIPLALNKLIFNKINKNNKNKFSAMSKITR